MNNMNFEDIIKLEGKSKELDECLYELVDKQGALDAVNSSIKVLNLKECVRKISNLVLGVLGFGAVIIPNALAVTFIIFCVLRLFMIKFVGFKTRSQRAFAFKMARMRKQFLECEVNDLIKNIEKLKVECDCQEMSSNNRETKSSEISDEVKENNYSYVCKSIGYLGEDNKRGLSKVLKKRMKK